MVECPSIPAFSLPGRIVKPLQGEPCPTDQLDSIPKVEELNMDFCIGGFARQN
jgi:hypothetical protein